MSRLCLFCVVSLLGLTAACVTEEKPVAPVDARTDMQRLSNLGATPEHAFASFCRALREEDFETVQFLTHSVERGACDWNIFKTNYYANEDAFRDRLNGAKMDKVHMDGRKATGWVEWGTGEKQMMEFTFEEGLWRVGGDKYLSRTLRDRPAPEPASTTPAPAPNSTP